MTQKIIVLFNLKPGTSHSDYEEWARTTDLSIVRKLASVDQFDVLKCQSVLGADTPPPYEYVEILDVNDMELFGQDVSTQTMKDVADQFQSFADNPTFIITENIESS